MNERERNYVISNGEKIVQDDTMGEKKKPKKKLIVGIVVLALLAIPFSIFVKYSRYIGDHMPGEVSRIQIMLIEEMPIPQIEEELERVKSRRSLIVFAPTYQTDFVDRMIHKIEDSITELKSKRSDGHSTYEGYADRIEELEKASENQRTNSDSNEPSYRAEGQSVTLDNNGDGINGGLSIDEPTEVSPLATDARTGQPISKMADGYIEVPN